MGFFREIAGLPNRAITLQHQHTQRTMRSMLYYVLSPCGGGVVGRLFLLSVVGWSRGFCSTTAAYSDSLNRNYVCTNVGKITSICSFIRSIFLVLLRRG
jgi:hypothetical protein